MSKPARNKKARLKTSKTSDSRHQEIDEQLIRSNLMKYAEDMFEFDEKGNVIKRNYDTRGIEIQKDEDEEIDPDSLKDKELKKVKLKKQSKKVIDTNKEIDFADLLKKPD